MLICYNISDKYKSFYLTFDPSFNLHVLKRTFVKLKKNLVSVSRKRNLIMLKWLFLECFMDTSGSAAMLSIFSSLYLNGFIIVT